MTDQLRQAAQAAYDYFSETQEPMSHLEYSTRTKEILDTLRAALAEPSKTLDAAPFPANNPPHFFCAYDRECLNQVSRQDAICEYHRHDERLRRQFDKRDE